MSLMALAFLQKNVFTTKIVITSALTLDQGWIQEGGSLGSDEPLSETKKFFEAILVGMGLNLVR